MFGRFQLPRRLYTLACTLVCSYPYVYVFKHSNMRNDKFKDLREELVESSRCALATLFVGGFGAVDCCCCCPSSSSKHPVPCCAAAPALQICCGMRCQGVLHLWFVCRFVMGSNKLIQVALGKTSADEYKTNLSQLSGRLKGNVGLFFTKLPLEEVSAWLPACVCRRSNACAMGRSNA